MDGNATQRGWVSLHHIVSVITPYCSGVFRLAYLSSCIADEAVVSMPKEGLSDGLIPKLGSSFVPNVDLGHEKDKLLVREGYWIYSVYRIM